MCTQEKQKVPQEAGFEGKILTSGAFSDTISLS